MIRHSPLCYSAAPNFRSVDNDHPPGHEHCDPAEETVSEYSVNRLEFGSFTLEVAGQQWELSQGDLFCTYPGMTYRCRHLELMPTDVCVSFAFIAQDVSREISEFESASRAKLT